MELIRKVLNFNKMLLVSLQVFKPKLKIKSKYISKSFKFNPKTLSYCLAKYKIKVIRTCRHKEKNHKTNIEE